MCSAGTSECSSEEGRRSRTSLNIALHAVDPDSVDASLLPKLALLLSRLVANSGIEPVEEGRGGDSSTERSPASPFSGHRAPAITIEEYLVRLQRYTKCSPCCFVMALAYINACYKEHPETRPCSLSIHRLVLTGVLLASKITDDKHYSNVFWARVGGVSLPDLNRLELQMLALLNFRLLITPEAFRRYLNVIISTRSSNSDGLVPSFSLGQGLSNFPDPLREAFSQDGLSQGSSRGRSRRRRSRAVTRGTSGGCLSMESRDSSVSRKRRANSTTSSTREEEGWERGRKRSLAGGEGEGPMDEEDNVDIVPSAAAIDHRPRDVSPSSSSSSGGPSSGHGGESSRTTSASYHRTGSSSQRSSRAGGGGVLEDQGEEDGAEDMDEEMLNRIASLPGGTTEGGITGSRPVTRSSRPSNQRRSATMSGGDRLDSTQGVSSQQGVIRPRRVSWAHQLDAPGGENKQAP